MIKQKNKAMSMLLLLLMIVTFIAPMKVYANTRPIAITESESTEIKKAMGRAMGDTIEKSSITVRGGREIYNLIKIEGDNKLIADLDGFSKGNKREITQRMSIFVKEIQSSTISNDRQQSIMRELQDTDGRVAAIMLPLIFEDTKGDLFTAMKILGPFLYILNILLGIGAVLLIILVLFTTVMDLAYIGLPVWREHTQQGKEGSGKNPFGVSYEAISTVKDVEKNIGAGDYKNAYILYLQRRALTYVVLAICIMYLIGGGLSGIISFILNLASGITG